MIPETLAQFKEVWSVDFEFSQPPGEVPEVVCMVAIEFFTGKEVHLGGLPLNELEECPFDTSENSLIVAFYASAEMNCFKALGWDYPVFLLDLYAEFRNKTNGIRLDHGSGLLGAMHFYRHESISITEKKEMRELAMRGGPYTTQEIEDLIDYCRTDVVATNRLLESMREEVDLERALYRGEYMKSVAEMEFNGIPIDKRSYESLIEKWDMIKNELINTINSQYKLFDGHVFKTDLFVQFLRDHSIAWPRTIKGNLALDDLTLRNMSKLHPLLNDLYQVRGSLAQLRSNKLSVSSLDFRNRTLISPFRSKTGRNQPSNSRFIFGFSSWFRALVKPNEGFALAYIDWSQQEFGIAAALSSDENMKRSYRSGDPYLEFAKIAGAAPSEATKGSHKEIRDLFKACVLAVQYSMGAESLALRIGKPVAMARELLQVHKETFKTFWEWSDQVLDFAMINGHLSTRLGWKINLDSNSNPRMIRNFPMQANGAEMLRIALNLLRENEIKILAPVHDAVLIEAPIEEIDLVVENSKKLMRHASKIILDGFELESDAEIIRYPKRYMDPRGKEMWDLVERVINN